MVVFVPQNFDDCFLVEFGVQAYLFSPPHPQSRRFLPFVPGSLALSKILILLGYLGYIDKLCNFCFKINAYDSKCEILSDSSIYNRINCFSTFSNINSFILCEQISMSFLPGHLSKHAYYMIHNF